MLSTLRTNQAYDAIRAPLAYDAAVGGFVIDKASRAFQEDVVFGLGLLVRMARQLDVSTPYLDEIHALALDHIDSIGGEPLSYVPTAWRGMAA